MPSFAPFLIHHLPIADVPHFAPAAQNAYLVFWWQKIPLGHLWIEEELLDEPAFRSAVVQAIAPSLAHYGANGNEAAEWMAAFLQGNAAPLVQFLESNKTLQTFSNPHAREKISVVICTRNRTQALIDCIKALQQSSDADFELVIVDNAPDDDSTEKAVQRFHHARYVREPRKGLDIARNTGARAASCAIIAYTDDDVVVDGDWIKNIKACFSDPKTMCVTGLVIPVELQTEAQYRFERFWGFNKGYVPLVFDTAYFEKHKAVGVPVWDIGAGANMAFRKSLFEQVGYFDERLDVGASGCSGDSEMWYRALAEGHQCNYFPHLFVYHKHRDSNEGLRSQIFHYMRGHMSALLVQHERYGHKGNLQRAYRQLPRYYLGRLKKRLLGNEKNTFDTLFTEVKGCISGWLFYRKNRRVPAQSND